MAESENVNILGTLIRIADARIEDLLEAGFYARARRSRRRRRPS